MAPPQDEIEQIGEWETYKGWDIEKDGHLRAPSVYVQDDFDAALQCNEKSKPPGTKDTVHHVLRSWRAALDGGNRKAKIPPLLMVCLKEDSYHDNVDFWAGALQDRDRETLLRIAPYAKAYGFDLYLACAEYRVFGPSSFPLRPIEDPNPREDSSDCECCRKYRWDPYGHYNYMTSDAWENQDYNMDELRLPAEVEISLALHPVVCMDGAPMLYHGDYVYEEEGLEPEGIDLRYVVNGRLKDGEFDAEFERFHCNEGTLTHTWKRTVLVMTPTGTDEFKKDEEILNYACSYLSRSRSTHPTPKEKSLAAALLNLARTPVASVAPYSYFGGEEEKLRKRAAISLGSCASHWNDVQLFLNLHDAYGPVKLFKYMGIEDIAAIVQSFNWQLIGNVVAKIYAQGCPDDRRRQFLVALRHNASADNADLLNWCKTQSQLLGKTSAPAKLKENKRPRDSTHTNSKTTKKRRL